MNKRTDAPALEFAGVSLTYHTKQGETLAADGLDFAVREGEFVAVIGPSGCGKTTLLSLAAGLLKPTRGKVLVYGAPPQRGTGQFGYMLQRDELFPWRTVERNIRLPLEIGRDRAPQSAARALALAEKYGLGGFLKQYPGQLSGGMRQRAALIRTLAADPDILLLDEPFSALDYQTRLQRVRRRVPHHPQRKKDGAARHARHFGGDFGSPTACWCSARGRRGWSPRTRSGSATRAPLQRREDAALCGVV